MQVDLEKEMNVIDSFKEIIKLSEEYLDSDTTNDIKRYFDGLVLADLDEDYPKTYVKTGDLIDELILQFIPRRIERLAELKAPQVIQDLEMSALESMKKLGAALDN
jgi:hypothetical protein